MVIDEHYVEWHIAESCLALKTEVVGRSRQEPRLLALKEERAAHCNPMLSTTDTVRINHIYGDRVFSIGSDSYGQ